MRRAGIVTLAALLATTAAGCWSMPGQGPRRQGHNPFETAITVDNVATLNPAWTTTVYNDPHPLDPDRTLRPEAPSDPVVSSGGLLHVTTGSTVQGFDASTGALVWRQGDPWWSLSRDPEVFGTADGRLAWSARSTSSPPGSSGGQATTGWFGIDGSVPASPGPNVGTVKNVREPWLVGTSGYTDFSQGPGPVGVELLRVGNLDDPGKAWVGRLVNGGGGSGLVLTDTAVIQVGRGLTAPDDSTPQNGIRSFALEGTATNCGSTYPDHACPQWIVPVDGLASSPVVLSDDDATIYFSTEAGTVYAASTADGTIHWSAAVGAGYQLAPALADGVLLVPTASGSLVALDADGCGSPPCTPLWTTTATGSALSQQPSVAGGVVFTGDDDGTLAAYDLAGCGAAVCDPLWSDELGARITGAPAISLGRVFVGVGDARLIAYAPSP